MGAVKGAHLTTNINHYAKNRFKMKLKRILPMLIIFSALLASLVIVPILRTSQATATPVALPVTATHTGDIQVSSCLIPTTACPNPIQVVLTTPAATFDGNPVTVDFSLEYANEIPGAIGGCVGAPGETCNGIGFELYEDGTDAAHHLERLTLFGGHAQTFPLFGPVFTHTVLDGAATPTAGTHTFYLAVWKWSADADGYLRAGDNSMGGVAQPMRLTIKSGY